MPSKMGFWRSLFQCFGCRSKHRGAVAPISQMKGSTTGRKRVAYILRLEVKTVEQCGTFPKEKILFYPSEKFTEKVHVDSSLPEDQQFINEGDLILEDLDE